MLFGRTRFFLKTSISKRQCAHTTPSQIFSLPLIQMQLPKDYRVSVPLLSSCFRSTSASYKYYWLLSILEAVEEGKDQIDKQELFARMIANAWYTLNYFRPSFGKQDKFQEAIEFLKNLEDIDISEKKTAIVNKLLNSSEKETQKQLKHFDNNVPYKFLSPWLGTGNKKEMYRLSQENYNFPPYALYEDCILIQPDWFNYFKRNSGVLKDFCYWNLTLFLQSRNPNVPGIVNKLKRPEKRGSLLKHKKEFWDLVIDELGFVDCIYTDKKLMKGTYDVEHFIPFQFVAHDLMWNLIPADPSFNSFKRDQLPPLPKYFDEFYRLQKEAVNIVKKAKPNNPFLQDYQMVFPDLKFSSTKYRDWMEPILTTAHNNSFQYMNQ